MSASRRGSELASFFASKKIGVTGAAGSVGREIITQLLHLGVAEIRAFDNDENGLFQIESQFSHDGRIRPRYCDVSSWNRISRVFEGLDYIFHSAALKHVPICEQTPLAAVDVNVIGVTNVVEAALECGVKRVVFTSSDKAVNPTNVMGASKLLGERIAASGNMRNGQTLISCTRFGNVAASRGSVIPTFEAQILRGGPLTLTSPEMTRFFMTLREAGELIIESMFHAHGGEIFVTKMSACRISDLARVMVKLLAPRIGRSAKDIEIQIIGPRMGEKLWEELTTDEEQSRAFDIDKYLIIQPVGMRHVIGETIQYEHLGTATKLQRPYNSRYESLLSEKQIAEFIERNNLLSVGAAPALVPGEPEEQMAKVRFL
jgi:FlaA1/EpsC-like NDP-sugar epimerase